MPDKIHKKGETLTWTLNGEIGGRETMTGFETELLNILRGIETSLDNIANELNDIKNKRTDR